MEDDLVTIEVDIDLAGMVAMVLVRRGYDVFMSEHTDYLGHPTGVVTMITTADQQTLDTLERCEKIRLK